MHRKKHYKFAFFANSQKFKVGTLVCNYNMGVVRLLDRNSVCYGISGLLWISREIQIIFTNSSSQWCHRILFTVQICCCIELLVVNMVSALFLHVKSMPH